MSYSISYRYEFIPKKNFKNLTHQGCEHVPRRTLFFHFLIENWHWVQFRLFQRYFFYKKLCSENTFLSKRVCPSDTDYVRSHFFIGNLLWNARNAPKTSFRLEIRETIFLTKLFVKLSRISLGHNVIGCSEICKSFKMLKDIKPMKND